MLKSITRVVLLLLLALTGLSVSCKNNKTVYLAPIGKLSSVSVEELKDYYQSKFGIKVETLASLSIDSSAYSPARRQFIAEELIAQIKRGYPNVTGDRNAVLIGVTDDDMYIRQYDWQFAFSFRQGDRIAVVSAARMNPLAYGREPNETLLRSRVRKMITKNIGIMYYGKSPSDDPRSVLYKNILGLEELDYAGEDF